VLQELRIASDCQSFPIVPDIAVETYSVNCSSQRNNALDYKYTNVLQVCPRFNDPYNNNTN